MSNYKRLTDKRLAIPKNTFRQSKSKEEYLELSRIAYKTNNIEIYNRLAELEDAIEQGTLIELPCKVGDKVYVVYSASGIQEWEVTKMVVENADRILLKLGHQGTDDFNMAFPNEFGECVFFTKEEAEKRRRSCKMDKTCETCKHFLRKTRKGGACAVHPFVLTNRGVPIICPSGKNMPFYTYCSRKACLKHEEKEV